MCFFEMDQAERMAQELNRSGNDDEAGLFSDSQSEGDQVEEIDDRDCITLENVPTFQLKLTQDEVAKMLEHEISEAIAITTFEEDSKMEKICNFDCSCYGRKKENSSLGSQSRFSRAHVKHTDGFFSSRKGVAGHENHWTS
ncbi:hypothetical protein GOODEAATRI_025123 [Goodea atripinnis]|uniref:Uncharacterized protein n=1 Tax=Goodea atripinnis TaxID=208336 RepID=A0ABV0NN05_9TELE